MESTPPPLLNDQIEADLTTFGVERYTRKKFCKHRAFTTTQRLILMQSVRRLIRVAGFQSVLEAAIESESEADALETIEIAQQLAQLHAQDPIERIEYLGLPIAILRSGIHQVYSPKDYVHRTQKLTDAVANYRNHSPNVETRLVLAGQITADSRKIFDAAGIDVVQNGRR